MKTLKKIVIVNAIILAAFALTAFIMESPLKKKTGQTPAAENGFAVLELFSSEGCNSCPPAEELLAQINREFNGKPVYVLAFHVDYFDNLGWKDVFGSPENTRRQKKYSSWLNAQVYTPQLVINGSREFIGSDEAEIRTALNRQLTVKQEGSLTLTAKNNAGNIDVAYQATNAADTDDLVIALIQKEGSSNIIRGENAGRNLSHIQIVRNLATVSLKDAKAGATSLGLPKKQDNDNWQVIGFLQNRNTGAISAASSVTPTK